MTIFTLAARQLRSGTLVTSDRSISANAAGEFSLRMDIAEPDFSDPAKSAELEVQRSPDGGTTWLSWALMVWQGNTGTGPGGTPMQPGLSGDLAEVRGQRLRAVLVLYQPLTTGATLELP